MQRKDRPVADEPEEPVECASPPCLAGEIDPAYLGLVDAVATPTARPAATSKSRRKKDKKACDGSAKSKN